MIQEYEIPPCYIFPYFLFPPRAQVCLEKEFNGFLVDEKGGKSYFRQQSRAEFLDTRKSNKTTKGWTLYVTPDPVKESATRMQKCVKGEGMPLFKNSMLRGNLFVDIEIDFPKSISEDAAAVGNFFMF